MKAHTIMVIWVTETFSVQFFCVFLPSLLNPLCFSQDLTMSVLQSAHFCMKCSIDICNVLEQISSFTHSVVFSYFFVLATLKSFLSFLALLCNFEFSWLYLFLSFFPSPSLLSSAIYKSSLENTLPSCISFSLELFQSGPLI